MNSTSTPQASATWRLFNLRLAPLEAAAVLQELAASELGLDAASIRGLRIVRKALDARRRNRESGPEFVCHVDVTLDARTRTRAMARLMKHGTLKLAPAQVSLIHPRPHPSLSQPGGLRAVVVGSGPAGLFAAWVLSANGVRTSLIERGPMLQERARAVARFHQSRIPDPERNLLFGEGGAGTYSDGKIYTRVDDPLEVPLLEELVSAGAPPSIVYDSLAHIGTDRLHRILPVLRERLVARGVEFLFDTRFDGLVFSDGDPRRLRAVSTTRGELPADALFLATGHSARDTCAMLAAAGVEFEAKPFQLGLRIEHPQELITRGRYGIGPSADALGPASYNLLRKADDLTPAAFSFCMCPGGRIVASVNEQGLLCTNGMSNSRHSSAWATAALVTSFGPREFGGGAFAGVEFQRELEALFFREGGGDFTAPAQSAADFLDRRLGRETRHSTYTFGTRPARLDQLLPEPARSALTRALYDFERQIPGFASAAGEFVGLESRSSGPLRMPRDPRTRRARGWLNLFPIGEGAGWAGGIMSAMLDGANSALSLVELGATR
ncbi:MAG: FAD-dependent protein [Planctomycetota bacterium]